MNSSDTARPYISPLRTSRFWITIGLCAIIYIPALFWTLGLDQNIFAEIGSLILKGQKPYVNAWDVKPPNVFYTYAFFEWLFGQNDLAVRISDYVFTLFACFTIYLGVDRRLRIRSTSTWMLKWAPVSAALLMVLTLLSLGLSDTAQTESYALGFILLAAYLSISRSALRLVLAGGMIAIAAFFKTTNIFFLVPLLIEINVVKFLEGQRLRAAGLVLLGVILGASVELAALAANGALGAYLSIASAVVQHHTNEPGAVSFASLLRALWISIDIWVLLGAIGVGLAIGREDRVMLKVIRLPMMYIAFGLLSVYVQHKGWGYHYVITEPGLISTCAISTFYALDELRKRSPLAARLSLIIVIAATILLTPSARRRIRYAGDMLKPRSTYLAGLGAKQSLYFPPCTDSLAQYLVKTTEPNDSVFIFGEEPGAYWKSNRQPANKYVYALLFTSGVIDSRDLRSIGYNLALSKPAAIVVERYDTTAFRGHPETSESIVSTDADFIYLGYLLETEYTIPDTVCDKFLVYHRR